MRRLIFAAVLTSVLRLWGIEDVAVAIRFDDNHAPEKWKAVAEVFEKADSRCSFAVCSGRLTPEQGKCLKELSDRGFEIMDHTSSHAIYEVQYLLQEDFAKVNTNQAFVAKVNAETRKIYCTADVDLKHEKNFIFRASVSNSVLVCTDANMTSRLSWTKKVWIPSKKALFGIVFSEGRMELRDFWRKYVPDFNLAQCEMVLVHQGAIQPCADLLRMNAEATKANFAHFGLPSPKTWIQPGGWEAFVDARRLRDVYGAEFGYTGADCVMPIEASWSSVDFIAPDEWRRWMQRPSFTFFDNGETLQQAWGPVAKALKVRRPLPIISHISVSRAGGLEKWLDLTRQYLKRLKDEKVATLTWAQMSDRFYGPFKAKATQLGRLTPAPGPAPRINTPAFYGARPGHEIVWRVPVTGERPMAIAVGGLENLPGGKLKFDPKTQVLRGIVGQPGDYPLTVSASNRHGKESKKLILKIGDRLALTPPLGWNSWNCHYGGVNEGHLKAAADKLVESGLADLGYQYVNMDAWWQINNNPQAAKYPEMHGAARDKNGRIMSNAKFPDMKALTEYIHSKGLKCGIYSSPGPFSCGGCETSWRHEYRDAARFAEWGFDYLKYDWCSYANVVKNEKSSKEMFALPYRVMGQALARQKRDIVFAMCEYGMDEPWFWGESTGAQLWRTTGDVHDKWERIETAINIHRNIWFCSKPGAWNDPDMLVLKADHRKCGLTPNEQYTHISMWSLFAAPMLIGCKLPEADEFTMGLLANPEIIEIDQDALGAAAAPITVNPFFEVWARPLANGDVAYGIFNPSATQDIKARIVLDRDLGLNGKWMFRDVWRRSDIGVKSGSFELEIPAHMTYVFRAKAEEGGRIRPYLTDIRNMSWQRKWELKRPLFMYELNANSPEPGGKQPDGFKFSP